MSLKASLTVLLSQICLFCTAGAYAQSGAGCPTLPANTAQDLEWVKLQTDTALLCRAIIRGNGVEAFALTLTKKSPFKPEVDLREERGNIEGKKMWWYRSEIAGRPDELSRETLVKLESGSVMHVSIRTGDAGTMARYQQLVQDLDFVVSGMAER